MLQDFLKEHREELVRVCRARVAKRTAPKANPAELEHGIPIFLDQLIRILSERTGGPTSGRDIDTAGPDSAMADDAKRHGAELLQHAFTIDQVVHDYGDLCQAIMDLTIAREARIEVFEFRTLNGALDEAIAQAVTAYSSARASLIIDDGERAENQRLGVFAHELRNLLHTATLALTAIKAGRVSIDGATGRVLERSLVGLNTLVDRSLGSVRDRAGLEAHRTLFSLADFITDARVSAALLARFADCALTVPDVDPELALHADRDLMMGAVGNLLQNAFKFSERPREVLLRAFVADKRIFIEVADSCGGLPDGDVDAMFAPFHQASVDRSGIGMGLAISRRSVEASGGTLTVQDRPPKGCVFTIDMPRHTVAPHASVDKRAAA